MNRDTLFQNSYDKPVEIAEGIFWVGYYDESEGLHCNPYLIIEGDEAVLIDGGNRPDFSTVMIKIIQTGIKPSQIKRLIYQHYDPDLCGSIPYLEDMISSPELKIISHRENNIFIKYYAAQSPRLCIEEQNFEYTFSTGRTLRFVRTPYSHSVGSFVTYDVKTGTLLSSDIFGGYGKDWDLYLEVTGACHACTDFSSCTLRKSMCPFSLMLDFHRRLMTSTKALHYALDEIQKLNVKMIAPQHGSILYRKRDIDYVIKKLKELEIGIDSFLGESRD